MVAPVRILVVDDEIQIAQLLAGVLRGAGHDTAYETDGRAALMRLERDPCDLLVTDLRMPGMDGLRLIEAARKANPDVDALIMTAYASADSAVQALRGGIADYLPKPFGVEEIKAAVEKALAKRQKRRASEIEVKDLSTRVESTRADLERRVADLSFLHDLTRIIASRMAPVKECLVVLLRHLDADSVFLTEAGSVVHCIGADADAASLELARRSGVTGRVLRSSAPAPLHAIAAPVGAGAVVARRAEPFDAAAPQLLSIAARDLALAVENDRLREGQRRSCIGIVATLIEAVEAKDRFNRGHSRRVADLAVRFAHELGLPVREVEILETAAKLHDIGKIGVPEEILNKPGRLDDQEFDIIKSHPVIGEQILQPLEFLAEIRPVVRHHHERWDGRGYPDGLRTTDIPRSAAMLAIVDAFDAMTSTRPYRAGLPREKAHTILLEGAGTQWDPELVRVFGRL
ncbi:MAG: HD domain-containing phosphohydrolase [Planctomycetaceae bacterium]